MDVQIIRSKAERKALVFSLHAEEERMDEGLTAQDIITAITKGEVLEQYPDTGRGESCLMLGFVDSKPIPVYVPAPPHFSDPWTRMG
jgi:hypothetical protein